MKAEENVKEATTAAFMAAPIRRKRRRRLSRSSSKSSASGLCDSKEPNSFNSPSEGSPNDSDLGDGEGNEEEEEEEDDDDEEEMEYPALDYPQQDSRDDTNSYASWSP